MDNRDGPALARVDVLKYEQRFDEDTMQRYQQLLIFAYQDPENPGHLLTLMEFLLQQGLNKAALAILQRAMHIMASYEHYKPGKYEQCLLQLLRSHLSIKGHGAFTSYGDVLKMVDVFPTQPLVLTAVASYFTRLHHLDWAKVLCVGALMQSPSYEMALVQLAQIAYLLGDLKHASRLLQRNGQENEHGRWSRKGKLEAAWLLEMLEADDEALVVGYKALIAVHTRDTVQSKTLLALGSLYQRMRKFRLAIDFYQRAWQMDRDDGMIPWCFATAQSVQYVQNRVIPSSIPAICVDNGGSYNTSAEANVVGDMMMAAATSGGEGGGRGNKGATPSERPLSAKATLTRTTRPKSAGATGRANTLRPSTTHHRSGENRPLVSTSFTALPASSAAKTTSGGQASASATARASPSGTAEAAVSSATISMAPSVIAQLPPNKKSTATVTVAEQTAKPLASVSLNATWKATADALYRRSLVLMADASYHWIALLSYGDFVLASMQDTKRALEYYEDAAKESFSTQIWPIVALGGAYQYVTNDYAAAKRLFTRALWSRHPPTDSRQRSHRSQAAQLSTLVTFGGFLRKRMKGDHGHVASASQVSSSSQHGRRTRRHVYADDDGDQDQDEDGTAYFDGDEDGDLARGTGSMEDSHQRHRDDALRMLQSVTLSRVSYPNTHGHGGADTATMDGGCASAFQRRAQDTKNLTVQEKECQVLYIAIAYLLWDMHETDAAYRYALAALKLQPTYSPALRCVGFLVYYVHQDMRLAFRYFAAAAEAAFSTVDMVGNPDAAGTTTTSATTSSSSSSSAAGAASASASTSSSAMMMSTPRCHSLLALQTLAIVRGLRCQYDQAIAAMERVLIQSTTCRFAHRCLAVCQGCGASSTTPHTIYPLALYHLGQIAEEENDLVTAERLMADAVAVEHIHPVTFTQLLDCITKNLTLHKQRLKELKRPYTKKGHKKRNGKTATAAADSLLGSTFSDTPDGKHQGTGSKPSHKSSKKTYQVGKVLKDVKLSYPKLSTYAEVPAGAATGRMSQKRRLMKKLSSQQAQLQLGLPMGALDMVKSFFYVDYDWLERCLYATAKCDDWASLLQCYHK
eukprot:gene8100-5829_t